MKRKLALLIAALTLATSPTACGNTETPDAPVNSDKAEVTTTTAEETTTTEATTTAPETTVTEETTTVEETTVAETEATTVATEATTATTTKKPEFEEWGITCDLKLNTKYDYTIQCYKQNGVYTNGYFTLNDFKTFKSDANHPAMDGYEWQTVTVYGCFAEDNASSGVELPYLSTDYYDSGLVSKSYNSQDKTFTVNYNGKDYSKCKSDYDEYLRINDDGAAVFEIYWYFRVPVGYDGVVLMFPDKYSANMDLSGDYTARYFRLKK